MTVFGISGARLALYGGAIAALVALNLWRLAPEDGGPTGSAGQTTVPGAIPDLPELRLTRSDAARADAPERDLFRPAEEAPPPPPPPETEPEPEPEPAPPPDPNAAAIRAANEQLAAVSVLGVMVVGDVQVAVLQKQGRVVNIEVGDELVPGFRVNSISQNGILVTNEDLGMTRRIDLGVPDEE